MRAARPILTRDAGICTVDVLEHIPDPGGLFERGGGWLAPDACVLVRGLLDNDRLGRTKARVRHRLRLEKQLPGYPLDAGMFTTRSLTWLLEQSGCTKFSWIGLRHDFGNLVACRSGGPRPRSRTIERLAAGGPLGG
jgi:hypothetical protein